jgi:hypothetical protein
MDAISRRTLLTSGGMAAAVAFAGGISPSRARAVETPLHAEDNVIAKSINTDPSRVPTLHGRLENRQIAFISTIFPNVPGLRLDACCYEPGDGFLRLDLLGMAIPGDNQLILAHRIQNYPGLIHETTLTAEPGAIEAIGRLKVDPKVRVGELKIPTISLSPNMCWGFRKSPNFVAGGIAAPPYGESPNLYPRWISRCFIFTEQGMTFLDRTDRQKTNEVPLNDPRNNPTWSQHYVGVWQRLKGEPLPVNTSRSRYVVPVIGAVSNDGKYMIALACDSPRYSAQAWHTCLHHVVNWGPEKAPVLERQWRMKLYAGANEPLVLMTRMANDFPAAMQLKEHAVAGP